MYIQLNGEQRQIPDSATIQQLLEQLKIQSQMVAVELNENVVSRTKFPDIQLKSGDVIEIVHMVGGGADNRVLAEAALHKLGFPDARVRHDGQIAHIELPPEEIPHFLEDDFLRDQVSEELKKIGYIYVSLDLEGYQRGRLQPL